MKTPLFPLNALVCPGGRLPLRIFEARYLDMISHCLKLDTGFVIVMLREDASHADSRPFYQLGSLTKIVDFGQTDDGLVTVTAEGVQRVRIAHPEQQDDGLWLGDIEPANEEDFVVIPDQYEELKDVLRALVQHPTIEDLKMDIDYQDGRQVGWRLTELLPLDNADKQRLFELNDPISRLEKISDQLTRMVS